MEVPTPRQWICPTCSGNLEYVGVCEIKSGITARTLWSYEIGRWHLIQEVNGDEEGWHLECRGCWSHLPSDLTEALWVDMRNG